MKQETEIKRLIKLDKVQVLATGKLKLDIYEIKKVLYHNTAVSGLTSEVLEGLVQISGKTRTHVCFVDAENAVRTEAFETSFEAKFQSSAVDVSCQIVNCHATIVDNEITIFNNDEINLKCAIEVRAFIAKTEKIITETPEDENLIVKTENVEVLGLANFGKYNLNQEVSVKAKDNIKEVVQIFASPIVENVDFKGSVVMVSGRTDIKMVYLTNEEDPQIKTVMEVSPFSEEIASADENYICTNIGNIFHELASVVEGDEVRVNIKTEMSFEIFSKTNLSMAVDSYSMTHNLNSTYSSFENCINENILNFKDEITGNVNTETKGAVRILGVVPKEVILANVYRDENFVVVEGVAKVNSMYEETLMEEGLENKNLNSTEVEIPFSLKAKCAIRENENLFAQIKFCKTEIKQLYNTEARISCELFVNITNTGTKTFGYISGIETGEELSQNTSSLSLYMTAPNDTMWKICKKLMVKEDMILEQNPEINPSDLDRKQIVIYRQKTK